MPSEVKWAISLLAGVALLWVGWRYFSVLLTLHIIICLVLIGVILLQSGEAADLAGAFGGSGSQTAFGPRGATSFLSRATTWCAIMFMFTSLEMTLHISTTSAGGGSVLEQFSKPAATAPAPPKPAGPTATPAPAQSAPAPLAPTQNPTPASPIQSPKPTPGAPAQSSPAGSAAPAAPAQSAPPASK